MLRNAMLGYFRNSMSELFRIYHADWTAVLWHEWTCHVFETESNLLEIGASQFRPVALDPAQPSDPRRAAGISAAQLRENGRKFRVRGTDAEWASRFVHSREICTGIFKNQRVDLTLLCLHCWLAPAWKKRNKTRTPVRPKTSEQQTLPKGEQEAMINSFSTIFLSSWGVLLRGLP